eukprot:CAMPEP_0179137658 /NCGR_PEP_ID=MMETSP0796-20121207/65683_1 /TAXON_ID=73915 /ORGANISM="Pyrodinium bahamense, Strain pbaha01" /LENGTH=113 /DNA_ID=CAMNT_0020836855 /DNA_START=91 /DNA_END=430 /DNA_ORIENTATION=+
MATAVCLVLPLSVLLNSPAIRGIAQDPSDEEAQQAPGVLQHAARPIAAIEIAAFGGRLRREAQGVQRGQEAAARSSAKTQCTITVWYADPIWSGSRSSSKERVSEVQVAPLWS